MNIIIALKEKIKSALFSAFVPIYQLGEKQLVCQALVAAKVNRSNQGFSGLYEAEFCAFSQWGEDGIIDWLVERLPSIPHSFVEFGVENYQESNTRLLLKLRNWRGLVIDGSEKHIQNIKKQDIYWRYGLTAKRAFIDRENINVLLAEGGMQGDIGLLSIDIDGNDYWIWEAIDSINPAIVVCEYNAVLGDRYEFTVPYKADFLRSQAHYSNLYFGASLRALVSLGKKKGYTFVGTNSTGCNAFFVRDDRAKSILDALGAVWAFPSVIREARSNNGKLCFVNGKDRANMINQCPVFDLERDKNTTLEKCLDMYSPEWELSKKVKF